MDLDLYARLAATGKPECPQCGYSLEGLPGPHRCPECNYAYEAGVLTWRLSRGPGLLPFIATLPVACLLFAVVFNRSGPRVVYGLVLTVIWIGMVGALWYQRLVHRRDEFFWIDDEGMAWRFESATSRILWKDMHDARLSPLKVEVQIRSGHRRIRQIPWRLSQQTGLSVDDFLKFVRARCGGATSCDSPDAAARDMRDS